MEAIVRRMANGEDWMPGDNLQAAHKELREIKEWLAVVQKKSIPPSPHPKTLTRPEPTSPPNAPRGQSEVGDQGDTARNEANAGKASTPPRSTRKRGSKVSEADQVEHQLAGGQWEELGAVRKGGEIRIKVRSGLCSIGNGRY